MKSRRKFTADFKARVALEAASVFPHRFSPKSISLFLIFLTLLFYSCHTRRDSSKYFYLDEDSDSETVAYVQELTGFVDKLLHDKTTFNADLSAQLDSLSINLLTSPDGKLKIYTWWDGAFGTMVCHNSIYQTFYNNKFHAEFMQGFAEEPEAIRQVKSSKNPLNLVQFNFQESSSLFALGLKAFMVNKKGQLVPANVFECIPEIHDTIGGYSNIIYIESRHHLTPSLFCKGGWSDNFFFETTGKDIYMPHFIKIWEPYADDFMHDFYHHFEWDGEKFGYDSRLCYNPILSRYLDGDGWLTEEFELGESIVRIEKVEDGSYRYIAWKNDKMFSAAPDLVITQGWYHELKHEYCFKNGDYEYIFNNDSQNLRIMYFDPKTRKKREFASYDVGHNY